MGAGAPECCRDMVNKDLMHIKHEGPICLTAPINAVVSRHGRDGTCGVHSGQPRLTLKFGAALCALTVPPFGRKL